MPDPMRKALGVEVRQQHRRRDDESADDGGQQLDQHPLQRVRVVGAQRNRHGHHTRIDRKWHRQRVERAPHRNQRRLARIDDRVSRLRVVVQQIPAERAHDGSPRDLHDRN